MYVVLVRGRYCDVLIIPMNVLHPEYGLPTAITPVLETLWGDGKLCMPPRHLHHHSLIPDYVFLGSFHVPYTYSFGGREGAMQASHTPEPTAPPLLLTHRVIRSISWWSSYTLLYVQAPKTALSPIDTKHICLNFPGLTPNYYFLTAEPRGYATHSKHAIPGLIRFLTSSTRRTQNRKTHPPTHPPAKKNRHRGRRCPDQRPPDAPCT